MSGYPNPLDPANVQAVVDTYDEVLDELKQRRRNWQLQPLSAIFAAPRAGKRDDITLRAVPDEVMFLAHAQHRECMQLLEAAMEHLEASPDVAGNPAMAMRLRAMLGKFNRPYVKGNYGEPFYDPPAATKAALENEKGGWV